MKVESLRILNKKRKQSQRISSPGGSGGGENHAKSPPPRSTGTGMLKSNSLPLPNRSSDVGRMVPGLSKSASIGPGNTKESKESARRRFVWSVPLHQDFVASVFDIGLKCASPKLLLEMMPVVDGLTSEHIKSHLQKYRLHRQRSREEFLKSYAYLTDLDGNKGFGGGSAAATRKAAAAAAEDVKGNFPRFVPDSGPEEGRCASNCNCNDSPTSTGVVSGVNSGCDGVGGGKVPAGCCGGNEDGDGKVSVQFSAVAANGVAKSKILSKATNWVMPVDASEQVCGTTEGKPASEAGGAPRADGAGRKETAGVAPQLQAASGSTQAVTTTLLQSHLELLARGIDMQMKFHHHLREVVESQRTLQVQLLTKQGEPLPPPPLPPPRPSPLPKGKGLSSPRAPPKVAGMSTPATHGSSQFTQTASSSCLYRSLQAPNGMGFTGIERSNGGYRCVPKASQHAAESGSRRAVIECSKASRCTPKVRSAVDAARGIRTPPETRNVDMEQPPADSAHANVAVGTRQGVSPGKPDEESPQLNLASPRADFSLHSGSGVLQLPPTSLSMGRQGLGVGQRGYVPGEYTLISKSSETAAGGGLPIARGQTGVMGQVGGRVGVVHPDNFASRNPTETRGPLSMLGLVPPSSTDATEQETLALQRHMQTQMEMHRTMLEASADQANHFGAQRAWYGGEGAPYVGTFAAGNGEAAVANVQDSSSGEQGRWRERGGNGGGEAVRTEVGNKDQRPDALPLQPSPSDPGDSSGLMDIMQQDDDFDFNWLDRGGGELKPGDNPVSVRSAAERSTGEEQSSLFSFLMG